MNFDTSTPFALVEQDETVNYYTGNIQKLDSLADLRELTKSHTREILFMNPFRTIHECGYESHGDEPIIALLVTNKISTTKNQILALLDNVPLPIVGEFIPTESDESYMRSVETIQRQEIAGGNICQMIFSRILFADLSSDMTLGALSTYKNLLSQK